MEYNFNENFKKNWLSKYDINIKDIAEEFLNKTEYISINKFNEYLLNSLKEMLDYFNDNDIIQLQFFNPEK